MEIKKPKIRFYYSVIPFLGFVLLMWLIYWLNVHFDLDYIDYGIFPRTFSGLKGILFSPFIHGSLSHLFNNSFPILILGTALFYYYGRLGVKVFVLIYFLTGMLVWISARDAYHIGASGIIYGLAGFLFLSGVLRREKTLMALSLLVTFLYGSLFWGIFPVREHISWESHFWGGIVGFVLALYYRKEGPQRKKYDWELEEDEEYPRFEWEEPVKENRGENPGKDHTAMPAAYEKSNLSGKPEKRIIIKYQYRKNDNSSKN